MSDVWDLVHAERRSLVADLAALDAAAWDTPSLCPGWTVHDVAAHLVDNARTTPWRLVVAMARARFDFDRQNQRGVDRERAATPAGTLERLRSVVDRTSGPPVSTDSRLVEEVVHGEDVRVPLGISHGYAPEAAHRALAHQVRTAVGMGGGRERVAGLRLVATDVDLAHGDGPEVRGAAADLLLVVSGRRSHLDRLSGPGVDRVG